MTEGVLCGKDVALPPQVPDLTAVAERALTRALELCAERMGLESPQMAADYVRQGNAVARMYCCASMAQQIAESLGTSDRNVRAAYAPDYDVLFQDLRSGGQAPDEPLVSLLVWTQHKTAALDSLVMAWERAFLQACREKIGPGGHTSLLDVQILDDADVQEHTGSGQGEGVATRLAVYWMCTTNQVVDIVYERTP